MIACMQKCCTNQTNKQFAKEIYLPIFSENACQKWRCLREWSGAKLTPHLPAIRNNKGVEITVISSCNYFNIMYSNTEGIIPHIGKWVNSTCVTTSDPNELALLIQTAESGDCLFDLVSFLQQKYNVVSY